MWFELERSGCFCCANISLRQINVNVRVQSNTFNWLPRLVEAESQTRERIVIKLGRISLKLVQHDFIKRFGSVWYWLILFETLLWPDGRKMFHETFFL